MTASSKRQFTGKHMALTMVGGFGIVAAVNFYMAAQAVGGFHGIVVENSYVASQKFNTWMNEADRMAALGWGAEATRASDGRVIVATSGVPQGAVLQAQLRRPIGTQEFTSLAFAPLGDGLYQSLEPVGEGRWTVRLVIKAEGERWAEESEMK